LNLWMLTYASIPFNLGAAHGYISFKTVLRN
jgi:hypothetical protein